VIAQAESVTADPAAMKARRVMIMSLFLGC